MKRVVHSACPHDCPDACGVLITVEDGRATRIQGDPEHPVTRGFLCAKVSKYLDRVYSPERVLYPMRRKAAKGTGGFEAFERISWEAALDEIASRLAAIARQFGAEAILPYSYGGTLGVLGGASMDRRFFHRLGASQLDRTICSTTGEAGIRSVTGAKMGTEPEQFAHSRYIIAWGANIHGNNVHLWPFIEEARRKGAKLVVIDPFKTRTANCADWYLPINLGTDVALALAMMHVIINQDLHDAAYVAQHTLGFDELRKRVQEYPPERVAALTGISAEDIRTLAREYATTRPAVIRVNYGVQRVQNGGMAMRAITMLPCITGSWKEVGGGLVLSLSGAFPLDKDVLVRTDLMANGPTRTINMVELGRALNQVDDPPVKALFVYNSNPAAVAPDHNAVVRGLKRTDLFTVVHEQFLTDTTDYADILLPATTFFEHKDLVTSYGHYWLQHSEQAIEPLGECKSNYEMFRELALRMGFDDACFRDSADDMMDQALAVKHAWLGGLTRERLERDHFVRLNFHGETTSEQKPFLPFANGFPTASGKAELYNAALAEQGLDPVATFVAPEESRHNADARYPLELLARKADNFLNSSFCNLPVRAMEQPASLEMTAEDAEARKIANGDRVRVFNDRGDVYLNAIVGNGNARVRPGVVAAYLDWAKHSPERRNINALTPTRLTDMGRGATFYNTLVQVERVGD